MEDKRFTLLHNMSFAIIKTGGKQYKVAEGDKVLIEKLDLEEGKELDFKEILLTANVKTENAKLSHVLWRLQLKVGRLLRFPPYRLQSVKFL